MMLCDEASQDMRADIFVSKHFPITRSYAQALIEKGNVLINGKQTSKNYKLRAGDEISVTIPPVKTLTISPENIPLAIVYEDEDVLVVNKPQGMVVHPGAGNDHGTLVNALMYYTENHLSDLGDPLRPGIVHRIDKDTSGLLLVAKNNKTHLSLAEQIREHRIKREYLCLVAGSVKLDSFTVDAPIGRHPKNRKKMAVVTKGGKEAITHFSVLTRYNGYTLLACRLTTGRTHQIRVHLGSRGYAIVGDPVYGLKKDKLAQRFNLQGQMLHAKTLGFIHPSSGEYLEFTGKIPDYFYQVLDYFKKTSDC